MGAPVSQEPLSFLRSVGDRNQQKRKLGITAAFDNNVMGLLPNEEAVNSDYLLLWTYTIDLTSLSKVGPVPSIRQSTVENQFIPLPPLDEQRRIVSHLKAVQEKVKILKEIQATTTRNFNAWSRQFWTVHFGGSCEIERKALDIQGFQFADPRQKRIYDELRDLVGPAGCVLSGRLLAHAERTGAGEHVPPRGAPASRNRKRTSLNPQTSNNGGTRSQC